MAGRWAGVSGMIEGDERPLHRARTEIREETGIGRRHIILRAASGTVRIRSRGRVWEVHPFLFDSGTSRVRLNWENSDYRWVRRGEMGEYRTVPGLSRVLAKLT